MSASFHQQAESNFQLLFQDALEKLTKKGFHVLINIDEVHLTPLLKTSSQSSVIPADVEK